MARWLTARCGATVIAIAATATASACASATASQGRSEDSSNAVLSASAPRCPNGTVGFAADYGSGGGAATAAEAVSGYVARIGPGTVMSRFVNRATNWAITPDSNGDGKTFSAPNVVLHAIHLPTGWIVDSGSYCR